MPRIPTYFSNAGLDTDRGGMPRVPVNDQLGSRLQQLGRVIGGLRANFNANRSLRGSGNESDRNATREIPDSIDKASPIEIATDEEIRKHSELRVAERAAFRSVIGLDRLVDRVHDDIVQKAREYSGDGQDFYADTVNTVIEPSLSAFLAAQAPDILPEVAQVADEQMEPLRQTAAIAQSRLAKMYSLRQLASARERARSEIRSDPETFDNVIGRYGQKIALSGLGAQERDAIGKEGLKDFSRAVIDHAVDSAPDRIDQLLGLRRVGTAGMQSPADEPGRQSGLWDARSLAVDIAGSDGPSAGTIGRYFERTYGAQLDIGQNVNATGFLRGFLKPSAEGQQVFTETAEAFAQAVIRPKRGDLVLTGGLLALFDSRTRNGRNRLVVADGQGDLEQLDTDAGLTAWRSMPARTGSLLHAALINESDHSATLIAGPPDRKLMHLSPGERLQEHDRAGAAIDRNLETARRRRHAGRVASATVLEKAIDGGQSVSTQDILDADLHADDSTRLLGKLEVRGDEGARSLELLHALAGGTGMIDAGDPQQTSTADRAWLAVEQVSDERTRDPLLRDFVRRTGYIPSRIRARLALGLASGRTDELADAVDLALDLQNNAPATFNRLMADYADASELEAARKMAEAGFTAGEIAGRILSKRLLGMGSERAKSGSAPDDRTGSTRATTEHGIRRSVGVF